VDEWLGAWRRCSDVRAFVTAARAALEVNAGGGRDEWLRWAEAYADAIDPLRATPGSGLLRSTPRDDY
jgi:hypothetical protein